MDVVEMSDIRELMEPREGPCVSICLTTHVSGPDELQDALRLRNLIDRADDQLARGWMRAPVARDWMAPVRSLPLDHDFWEKRNRGLAIFIADGFRKTFRVPIALEELSIVNHRFSVKSLLPLATDEDGYFILALSQKQIGRAHV